MTQKFGQWAPDQANIDNPGVSAVAKNVVPGIDSYHPLASLSELSNAPLAADCLGLTLARTSAGTWQIFAGTTTKLYKYATSSWTDYSRLAGGAYNATNFWRFAPFGANLIAVNGVDNPQTINVDSGTNFALLAGSPPVGRNVSIVGDFVVMSSLVSTPYRIQWSAINDSTGWTVGTSLSDIQDFADGGRVSGVAGGEVGYVLQEYAIRRMRFLPGSDYVFTFERVVDGKGCLSPYGYSTVAGTVYFLAEDGFYAYSGQGLNPIGAERVNRWFLDNADTTRLSTVYCVADPYRPRIVWAYYSSASVTYFDRLMIYDWQLDKWSYGEVTAQMWGSAASPGIGLDSLSGTLESQVYSFDSRGYEGGRPTFAGINTSRNLAFLEGTPLAATIETMEFHPAPGGRGVVTSAYPLVDTSAATVRIGARERYADAVSYSTGDTIDETGRSNLRKSGRLIRAEVSIPAAATWTNAIGVDLTIKPGGRR
jgi:hypothetical protein